EKWNIGKPPSQFIILTDLKKILFVAAMFSVITIHAQEGALEGAQIHGNFEVFAQTYRKDSLIGAAAIAEKSGINSYLNLIATKGAFSAGTRIEAYYPPIQGFDLRYGSQPI